MTRLSRLARLSTMVAALALAAAPAAQAQVGQLSVKGEAWLLAHAETPFAGTATASADVTVVEYFDFNCPYCRKAALDLRALMAADPRVRVLYKDWPVFGGVSAYAARACLAALWQGRYLEAHNILIGGVAKLASEADVRGRLTAGGVNLAQLDKDMAAHAIEIDAILYRNDTEAHALSLEGTPGLVVGPYVVPGALDEGNLRKLVGVAREQASAKR